MGKTRSRGNGEGTIFKRKIRGKDKWVCEYTLEFTEDGKRKVKTLYGNSRTEVKDKLKDLIIQLGTGKFINKSSTIFKDITKEFIDTSYKLNKLTDASYGRKLQTYNQICKHYMADMEIQKITERDVKDFLIYITKYSNSVIGKIYGLVNNTFKIALRRKIITDNFLEDKLEFSKPKSSKMDKDIRAFTLDEHKHFLEYTTSENNTFKYKYQLLLELITGMRMGEINALDIDKDIDFDKKIIHIRRTLTKDTNGRTIMGNYTKTPHSIRDLVMDNQVEYLLKEYLQKEYKPNKENLLFYNIDDDKYITTSQVNMSFKRLCEKNNISLGYDVNQHMLRHTFATRCIEAGMPANVLSKIMGHADIRTTLEIYCDVFAEYEKQHSNRAYDYLKENNLLISVQS